VAALKLRKKYAYNAWLFKWRICKGNGQVIKSFLSEKSADRFTAKLEGQEVQKIEHNKAKKVMLGFKDSISHGAAIAVGVAISITILSLLGAH
jgi:hypothetical protein